LLRKSYTAIFHHFVWATYERLPLIHAELERPLYRCIEAEVRKCGAEVIALGGIEDHVHLLVHLPGKIASARLMQQVKGVSAQFGRDFLGEDSLFRWQHSYGAFSLSRNHIDRVILYVENQKIHHARQKTWEDWECTGIEVD
jgi:putative transposase